MFCLLLVAFLSFNLRLGIYGEETWIEPNAWSRHSGKAGKLIDPNSNCLVCEKSEHATTAAVSHIYYKKLILNLFHRSKLKLDTVTSQFVRSVTFTLTIEELDKLEKSNDAREMDAILSKILENSKALNANYESYESYESSDQSNLFAQLKRLSKDIGQLTKSTEVRFTLLVLVCALLIWYLHRRYNRSIVGMLLISFLIIGYLCTYYECNRKQEIEEYIKFLHSETKVNPNSNWLDFFPLTYFRGTPKDREINDIRNSRKLKLPFCRPDTVFLMYINEMFVNQIEFFVEKCVMLVYKFQWNLSFPFNYISVCILPFLIVFMMKLIFKYIFSPKVWIGYFNREYQHDRPRSMTYIQKSVSPQDQVSGDNLKLLLKALTPGLVNANLIQMNNSGVQEVIEPLESKINQSSPLLNKTNNNNSSGKMNELSAEEAKEAVKSEEGKPSIEKFCSNNDGSK